jgi:hypothetical protein
MEKQGTLGAFHPHNGGEGIVKDHDKEEKAS